MEHDVVHVESDASHVLVGHRGFSGGPLEGGLEGVPDFVHVLDTLGDVDQDVGTLVLGSIAPNFQGFALVPAVGLGHLSSALLRLLLGSGLSLLNVVLKLHVERCGGDVESVVLVGRLGHADLTGGGVDCLLVGHDWFGLDDFDVAELLLQIVDADLDVQLAAAGDDVLAGLFSGDLDEGVGLGEFLQTLDELGEVLGVFGLDGHADDWRHGVLHAPDVVRLRAVGNGAGLQEVLVDADESHSVAAGHVRDVLHGAAHHQHGSLDGFLVKVVLLAGDVVGSLDADLHSGGDCAREDTAEGEEARLVSGGHHLGDVHHQRTLGVAVLDGGSAGVVLGTFVEVGTPVLLGDLG